MNNYQFIHFQSKNNKDLQGYKLVRGNEELETLEYDIDKISYKELKQRKKEFFNFICSKYQDIERQPLLMIFAYVDDDMLEYYKEQYPIEEKKVGKWILKDCPKRTEKYYKKITLDEKMFIDVALAKFRERFGYKVAI